MLGYLTTLPSFIHELVRAAVNSLGNRVPPHGKELWGTKLRFFRITVQRHSDVAYGADSVYAAFSVSPPAKSVAEEYGIGIGAKQHQPPANPNPKFQFQFQFQFQLGQESIPRDGVTAHQPDSSEAEPKAEERLHRERPDVLHVAHDRALSSP